MMVPAFPRGRSSAHNAFVDEVARNLADISTYVEAQFAAGRPRCPVLATQADALHHRLQNLAYVDMQQGSLLTLAVARGPWTDQQKERLSRTIDGLVANAQAAPKRRGLQHLPKPENTMLEVEWRSLRTDGPILTAKIAQVATRMWSIGLTCPSEPTSCKFAGVICVCCNIAEPDEQRDVFERLKQAVKALDDKRTYPHGHLLDYPPDMADWPEAMVAYAYSGERPIEVNMPELEIIMVGTQRTRGTKHKTKQNMCLRGLHSIKEDAEDFGANIQMGGGRNMGNARALLDKQVGSAESVGAASASASPASNVGDVAPARLASTTLWAFKPHLALPPPPDAINQGGGASTSVPTAERDPTAVERMMREAGVTQGNLKRVTWRRRITGKRASWASPRQGRNIGRRRGGGEAREEHRRRGTGGERLQQGTAPFGHGQPRQGTAPARGLWVAANAGI